MCFWPVRLFESPPHQRCSRALSGVKVRQCRPFSNRDPNKSKLDASGRFDCIAVMRMKWILLLAASTVITAFLGSGCATSVDGRMTPGFSFVKDSVEGRYEKPVLDAWTAAKDVLNYNGRVYSEDVMKSTIEHSLNQPTVWVKVEPI